MSRMRPLLPLLLALAACNRAPAPAPSPDAASAPASASSEVAVAPAAPAADPTAAIWQLPGRFAPDDDLERLQQRYGSANVRVADVPGAEGETMRGVILFPDDPSRRAHLYFQDPRRLRGLSLVEVSEPFSRWHLDNNVTVGMPLAQLLALNGRPIRFSGFDWDYGGAISDWNGGKLEPADDDPVRRGIRLTHGEVPEGSYPMGDATFSSDDPHYPKLGQVVSVGSISVSFPGEDDL